MKYYIIFFFDGKVIDIASYDDEYSRDSKALHYQDQINHNCHCMYDKIQTFNDIR